MFQYINKLIRSDTKESSIRFGMICIILMILLSMFVTISLLVYVVMSGRHPDWLGAAAFITSLSTMYGVAVFGKIKQKRLE